MPDEQHIPTVDDGPRPGLGQVVANVGDRIQEILDTAERVAGEIRAEAEAAAADYLFEQRQAADRIVEERMDDLAAVTQSLSTRAMGVEREATALIAELEEARRRLAQFAGPGQSPPADGITLQPAPRSMPASDGGAGSRLPEQAVLRATQMAVAGSERTDIERMLRDEFGIEDAESVVEGLLRST